MSRRQESIPYMLVHDCPWWVSATLAGVVYALMRWVAPMMSTDELLLGNILKALPPNAWIGAALALMLAGLNLWVRILKMIFQRAPALDATNGKDATKHDAAMVPQCPNCGEGMVNRTARRGANAGKRFWGCVRYPTCEGTRTL